MKNILRGCLMLVALIALMLISEWIAPARAVSIIEDIQTGLPRRYALTPYERSEIERTVMAEAGGESLKGQIAVAQCILTAAEAERISPVDVLTQYRYTPRRVEPSESVRKAVSRVFDRGEVITREPITLFYAPARVTSWWHESQVFVLKVGNHKFYKEAS